VGRISSNEIRAQVVPGSYTKEAWEDEKVCCIGTVFFPHRIQNWMLDIGFHRKVMADLFLPFIQLKYSAYLFQVVLFWCSWLQPCQHWA